MKIHFRAPSGTRIEQTEQLVAQAETHASGRSSRPPSSRPINSTIGVPQPLNLAFVPTDNVSEHGRRDPGRAQSGSPPDRDGYVQQIRRALQPEFPGSAIYFQTADIVGQVLNFGLLGADRRADQYPDLTRGVRRPRGRCVTRSRGPGRHRCHDQADARLPDAVPERRPRARGPARAQPARRGEQHAGLALVERRGLADVLHQPDNHVNYLVAVEVPLPQMTSARSLMNTPVTRFGASLDQHPIPAGRTTDPVPHAPVETLDNVAQMTPTAVPDVIDHYTVARVLDVTASVDGAGPGLGRGRHSTRRSPRWARCPAGMYITVRGQGEVMNQAFSQSGTRLRRRRSCSCTS